MVGPETDLDAVFDACRNHHQRIILAVLTAEARPLTVRDLTTAIIKHKHGTTPLEAAEGVPRKIRLSLVHAHLPKLESHSLIEYDHERGLAELTVEAEEMEPHLSSILDANPALEAPISL